MEQLKKKVRIVPMTNEYLNDVAELERTCFSNPWSRNMLAEELENACSAFLVALDAENGSVVGYAGLLAVVDEGCITKMAVRPDCRRGGVAGQLLDVFIRFAEGSGLAFLTLEVRESNYAAIALYGSRGFRGEGRTFEELIRDSRSKGFGEEVKRRILLGNYALSSGYYDAYYKKALALKQEIIKEYNDVFDIADVILTPTAPTPAYKIGAQDNDPVKMYLADICTVTVNIASLPGISTTCGYTADGLPIGMSVIGRRFDEQTILQCADAFEQTFAPSAPKL